MAPTISSLTYQEENRTLTCVSTGSPPTVVSWMKDGENIGHHFSLSQTITDRASSTYNNTLTVGEGATEGVAGVYNCTVSNVLGSDSTGITVVGEWNLIVYNLTISPFLHQVLLSLVWRLLSLWDSLPTSVAGLTPQSPLSPGSMKHQYWPLSTTLIT